jgi:hypothetical protein
LSPCICIVRYLLKKVKLGEAFNIRKWSIEYVTCDLEGTMCKM